MKDVKRIADALERIANVAERILEDQEKMMEFSRQSMQKGEEHSKMLMANFMNLLTGGKDGN